MNQSAYSDIRVCDRNTGDILKMKTKKYRDVLEAMVEAHLIKLKLGIEQMSQNVNGSARFSIESKIFDKNGKLKHHSLIDEDGEEKVYI